MYIIDRGIFVSWVDLIFCWEYDDDDDDSFLGRDERIWFLLYKSKEDIYV